jgi:hypothetical protein
LIAVDAGIGADVGGAVEDDDGISRGGRCDLLD